MTLSYDGEVVREDHLHVIEAYTEFPVLEHVPAVPSPGADQGFLLRVGESRTFRLKANVDNPNGFKVSVNDNNYAGDSGNLALGKCPGDEGESVVLEDGDSVTVTGCLPGESSLNLWHWVEHSQAVLPEAVRLTVWEPGALGTEVKTK